VALGRDIAGASHFGNIGKMPHALIAGATGSGKSVTIHAIITSLLYRLGPSRLRFLMIDPKRVELTLYNPIPAPSLTSYYRRKESYHCTALGRQRNGTPLQHP
jgi:DNA segregation ATPase FtsK/SpoIIIE-like protein